MHFRPFKYWMLSFREIHFTYGSITFVVRVRGLHEVRATALYVPRLRPPGVVERKQFRSLTSR